MITIAISAKKSKVAQLLRTYRQLKYFESTDESILNPAQKAFIKQVENAVNSLPDQEREVVTRRFMQDNADYVKDYEVYEALQISQPVFIKVRNRALSKLEIVLASNKSN